MEYGAKKFGTGRAATPCDRLPGIVIRNGNAEREVAPRIEAFVYGGESAPRTPTLPYGRWKGVA